MAQKKTGTSSASEKVAKVSGEVGRPNQSVAAIREQYKQEEERQKLNYANAADEKVLRKIRDLTRNNSATMSVTRTNKETIRAWLTGNIYSQATNLINAQRYLYYRSPIYAKMIHVYADMYCLDCRKITPPYDFQKGMDATKALKQYENTLDFLDVLTPQNTMNAPLVNMWLEDVSFNLFFHDDLGCFFWRIDPSEAIIDGVYSVDGGWCYQMAIDMSKWRSQQRQALIEFLGSPLDEMLREYERTNIKYIHVPAEYSFVIKFRTDMPDAIIPPLLPYLNQLASLNDLVDSQQTADELAFYKMIYLPLQTIQSAKNSDDWKITPDLAMEYFRIAADTAIPNGVSSAVIPGDELKTIEFSDNVSEDVNRVENSQTQILGGAGGAGALLNATKAVNNTELIKQALRAESAYVTASVLPQISAWINLQLLMNVKNYCRVDLMPLTIYTKEDYRKSLLEANQYGFSYRLAYGTLLGFSERQTMAYLMFETQALGLQNLMIYPLSSSFTSSSGEEVGQVGEGRPEKDPSELSPSGERSRNQ